MILPHAELAQGWEVGISVLARSENPADPRHVNANVAGSNFGDTGPPEAILEYSHYSNKAVEHPYPDGCVYKLLVVTEPLKTKPDVIPGTNDG